MNHFKKIMNISTKSVWNQTIIPKTCLASSFSTFNSQNFHDKFLSKNNSLGNGIVSGMISNIRMNMATSPNSDLFEYSSLDGGDRRIIKARRMLGIKKIPIYILCKTSVFLYESCTDNIQIELFIKHLELEDTYNTWFNITKLHVWMVATRCMAEGSLYGTDIRNELICRMWEDYKARMNKLCRIKSKVKKEGVKNSFYEFSATLFALDEGCLSDDIVLAGAIWRTIFGMNSTPKPQLIEILVKYIREQMEHLHLNYKTDDILFKGRIIWKPFPPLIPAVNIR